VLGTYMVGGGAISLALALDEVMGIQGRVRWIFVAVVAVAFAPLISSGVALIRRVRGAHFAGALAWIPLLFVFQVDRVSYAASVFPTLEWKIWPEFGFWGSFGPTFTAYWFADEQPFYYGVNLMALLAGTYLGERAWRRRVRLRRARKRRGSSPR